eukprot:6198892-Pleurochrysis_carterae.AAC.1
MDYPSKPRLNSAHRGLTSIDGDSKWSLLRLSNVGIDEGTITKIVAKINQINLERESIRQYPRVNAGSNSCR